MKTARCKPSFVICFGFTVLAQSTLLFAQPAQSTDNNSIISNIAEERAKITSYQAFGVREQSGSYFEPDPSTTPTNKSNNAAELKKYVYVAFSSQSIRMSESPFNKGDENNPARKTVSYFNTNPATSIYRDNTGFHLVRSHNGGRYVIESAKTTVADPPQSLGFWVPAEKKWSDELIQSGRYKLIREKSHPQFGNVLEYEGMKDSETKVQFTIAPSFGCRVVESVVSDKGQTSKVSVVKLVNIKNVWLPSKIERTITSSHSREPSTEVWKFDKILLNDAQEQNIKFAAVVGDHNHDMDNNRHSYSLGNGERRYVEPSGNSQPSSKFRLDWLYTPSVATLLVLTVLAYIRWKHKQSPQTV